jgi:recombination protein RecA
MAAVPLPVDALARFGVLHGTQALPPPSAVLSLEWPELDRVLPDHGLPRGVVEIASPVGKRGALRGGATTIALAAVKAAHARDAAAWCAWVSAEGEPSLYAPSVAQAGVDLDRLLVVRPPHAALSRTIVKVAASGAFDLLVVDAITGLESRHAKNAKSEMVVRKLALASEERGTTCVLLTNAYAPRTMSWPVALRLEVERRPESLALRVTKDRRGRASSQHVVRLAS